MKYLSFCSFLLLLNACNVSVPEGGVSESLSNEGSLSNVPNDASSPSSEEPPLESVTEFSTAAAPILEATVRPLGTVTVNSSNYTCGDKKCYDLTISCPAVNDSIGVTLYVSSPSTGVASKGLITFHSGYGGQGLWASEALSQGVINSVLNAGYKAVQVAWKKSWIEGSATGLEGVKKLGCRPATALKWIHDNLYSSVNNTEAFCSTGNSGGSVQISSALVYYSSSEYSDLVVPTSGPGVGRLDIGCSDSTSPLYLVNQLDLFDGTYGYLTGSGPCTTKSASFMNRFIEDSMALGTDGNYYYPKTMVWELGGAEDHGTATTAQSLEVHNRWLDANTPYLNRDILANTPHSLHKSAPGAAKLTEVLLTECRRHPSSDPVGPPPEIAPRVLSPKPCPSGTAPYFNVNGKTKIRKLTTVVFPTYNNVSMEIKNANDEIVMTIPDITHSCVNFNSLLAPGNYDVNYYDGADSDYSDALAVPNKDFIYLEIK